MQQSPKIKQKLTELKGKMGKYTMKQKIIEEIEDLKNTMKLTYRMLDQTTVKYTLFSQVYIEH